MKLLQQLKQIMKQRYSARAELLLDWYLRPAPEVVKPWNASATQLVYKGTLRNAVSL